MYLKEFEIRWSDLDANRHLANSSYFNFMAHTRMSYLFELGFDQKILADRQIGPVAFYEHMHYFKEIFPGKPITVSLEVMGMSEEGKFFEFHHNFYDDKGRNVAHCEMMGAWISLRSRSLIDLPDDLLRKFDTGERPAGFRRLTKADTRRFSKFPKDLE
jgi:acyl-CoA thioester hydrolase